MQHVPAGMPVDAELGVFSPPYDSQAGSGQRPAPSEKPDASQRPSDPPATQAMGQQSAVGAEQDGASPGPRCAETRDLCGAVHRFLL
jgi:hypothetical protein